MRQKLARASLTSPRPKSATCRATFVCKVVLKHFDLQRACTGDNPIHIIHDMTFVPTLLTLALLTLTNVAKHSRPLVGGVAVCVEAAKYKGFHLPELRCSAQPCPLDNIENDKHDDECWCCFLSFLQDTSTTWS